MEMKGDFSNENSGRIETESGRSARCFLHEALCKRFFVNEEESETKEKRNVHKNKFLGTNEGIHTMSSSKANNLLISSLLKCQKIQ